MYDLTSFINKSFNLSFQKLILLAIIKRVELLMIYYKAKFFVLVLKFNKDFQINLFPILYVIRM